MGSRMKQPDDDGYVETDPSGRYGRYDEVLGKGAMKTVYKAFDELNGIEVAWNQAKVCDVMRSPEALQRMYSEVHLLSTLDHDSIIRFYASWVDVNKRTFNFITEMFTSGTLREYRQRHRRVNIRAVKSWSRQILQGLVYLHGHDPPVIHRDLKGDNIFVNGHLGQVKIGDLGLAAILRGSQNAHSVIGTPEFMAPELYEEDYNELVDIYSFGMCVLEMLTSEFPYSECTNPAQIYKKVTEGKLPDAFNRIQDFEARRFIGRCLAKASKRSSAKELLLDPFLLSEDHRNPVPLSTGLNSRSTKDMELEGFGPLHKPEVDRERDNSMMHTGMMITGKMNPEDDTIFLKVQISDKEGGVRHIYFPFDILSDTPIDVANEMVKDLEITEWEPSQIAQVIGQEISTLVPDWKDVDRSVGHHHQELSYVDEEEEHEFDHPFCDLSSPGSSYFSEIGPGSSNGACQADWLRDDPFSDDDDTSSMHSGKYSAVHYESGDELHDIATVHQPHPLPAKNLKPTRLGPKETSAAVASNFNRQCEVPPESSQAASNAINGGKKLADGSRLTRNRSMVDLRSQLLHQSLVEAVKIKRSFKTVGAVENIGFQMPCGGVGVSRKAEPPFSPASRGDRGRKLGSIFGRGKLF